MKRPRLWRRGRPTAAPTDPPSARPGSASRATTRTARSSSASRGRRGSRRAARRTAPPRTPDDGRPPRARPRTPMNTEKTAIVNQRISVRPCRTPPPRHEEQSAERQPGGREQRVPPVDVEKRIDQVGHRRMLDHPPGMVRPSTNEVSSQTHTARAVDRPQHRRCDGWCARRRRRAPAGRSGHANTSAVSPIATATIPSPMLCRGMTHEQQPGRRHDEPDDELAGCHPRTPPRRQRTHDIHRPAPPRP